MGETPASSHSLSHTVNIKWMGLEEGKVLRDALLMEKGSDASGHYRGVYTMHLHACAHCCCFGENAEERL